MFFILLSFFLFNYTAPTEIYTLSLHDALPISEIQVQAVYPGATAQDVAAAVAAPIEQRSEEHTSELQSHSDLVCRLLLEKKKNQRRKKEKAYTPTQMYKLANALDA